MKQRHYKAPRERGEVRPLGFGRVPPVIQDGKLLIRGTPAWETRECIRQMVGCCCISFGKL